MAACVIFLASTLRIGGAERITGQLSERHLRGRISRGGLRHSWARLREAGPEGWRLPPRYARRRAGPRPLRPRRHPGPRRLPEAGAPRPSTVSTINAVFTGVMRGPPGRCSGVATWPSTPRLLGRRLQPAARGIRFVLPGLTRVVAVAEGQVPLPARAREGVPAEKIVVIRNGIDNEGFAPRPNARRAAQPGAPSSWLAPRPAPRRRGRAPFREGPRGALRRVAAGVACAPPRPRRGLRGGWRGARGGGGRGARRRRGGLRPFSRRAPMCRNCSRRSTRSCSPRTPRWKPRRSRSWRPWPPAAPWWPPASARWMSSCAGGGDRPARAARRPRGADRGTGPAAGGRRPTRRVWRGRPDPGCRIFARRHGGADRRAPAGRRLMRILQVNKFHWVKGARSATTSTCSASWPRAATTWPSSPPAHPQNDPLALEPFLRPGHAEYHGSGPPESGVHGRHPQPGGGAAARPSCSRSSAPTSRISITSITSSRRRSSPLERRSRSCRRCTTTRRVCPAHCVPRAARFTRCGPGARFLPVVQRRCLHDSAAEEPGGPIELTRSWRRGDPRRVAAFLAPSRFRWSASRSMACLGRSAAPRALFPAHRRLRARHRTGSGHPLPRSPVEGEGAADALRAALARARQVRLTVAGTGPLEPQPEMATRKCRPLRFLVTCRRRPRRGVLRAPGRAERVVRKSSVRRVLEAMALGVPVIGSRIGGIPEMVEMGSLVDLSRPGM